MFRMPITKMLNEMSRSELVYWRSVYEQEFLGEQREDYRTALVRSDLANYAGRALPEGKWVEPLDRMPYIERPEPTEAEIEANADAFFNTLKAAQEQRDRG
jgi:hypothetical protein